MQKLEDNLEKFENILNTHKESQDASPESLIKEATETNQCLEQIMINTEDLICNLLSNVQLKINMFDKLST